MPDLATIINCPWCALAILAIGFYPKLAPYIPLLSKLKPSPSPTPVPSPEPSPATGRPLLDLAMKLLAGVAMRKFPTLSEAEAVQRYAIEEAHYGYLSSDQSGGGKPA